MTSVLATNLAGAYLYKPTMSSSWLATAGVLSSLVPAIVAADPTVDVAKAPKGAYFPARCPPLSWRPMCFPRKMLTRAATVVVCGQLVTQT